MFQGISSTNVFVIILTVKMIIQAMDKNGDGSVSFDEWLSFSQAEIISKVFKSLLIFMIMIIIFTVIIMFPNLLLNKTVAGCKCLERAAFIQIQSEL